MSNPQVVAQQALVNIDTRLVVGTGFFPTGTSDPTVEIMNLHTEAWAEFQAAPPGEKYLSEDGTLTVVPLPPLVRKSAYRAVTVEDFQTTDATITSMVLWPLSVQTLYTARFTILAIDTGNGDCRVWYAKASAKRLGAGALLVGTPNIDTDHSNPGAAGWAIAADTGGNNFRVRVTGAAGRTISWNLVGEVLRARPTGLVD